MEIIRAILAHSINTINQIYKFRCSRNNECLILFSKCKKYIRVVFRRARLLFSALKNNLWGHRAEDIF